MVREIKVIKIPREGVITDRPINFAPLEGLHLELIENKRKLKKNLPPIKIVAKKPRPVAPPPRPKTPPPTPQQKKAAEEEDAKLESELGDIPASEEDDSKLPSEKDEALPTDDADLISDLSNDTPEPEGVDGGGEAPQPSTTPEPEAPVEEDPDANLSPEEREAKEKEEYLWRFRILKKQYKTREIPSFNEHDDIVTMKTTYDRTVREIHLENSVDNYRMYLSGGFMAIEYGFKQFLGVDMSGFAQQQWKMMDQYEIYLIELGEKSNNRWKFNLPVEVRLLGFILIQAGLFYMGKIIFGNVGMNAADMFRGMSGQPRSGGSGGSGGEEVPTSGGKKMKGPSIKIEDIRKMAEDDDAKTTKEG